METIQDLIEEAKLRTVWWALCIFAVSYFLTRKFLNFGLRIICLVSGVYNPELDTLVSSLLVLECFCD
jgi:sorting nexin-13